jgi:RTX calcium-binding nonapeptide repeat (4 copies)/Right handed beta helix region
MSVILDNANNLFAGTIANDTVSGLGGSDSLVGLQGNDSLFGNLDDDLIFGGQGIDILFGGQGNDSVFGGVESDNIAGEAGDDIVNGNKGNDFIFGGAGLDSLFGGQGDDFMLGEDGNDSIFGNLGNDSVFGGLGDDSLYGEIGIDIVYGGKGNDVVSGGDDGDAVFGDDGNDSVSGDTGNDLIGGGPGSDSLEGGDGEDFISGGQGNDRLVGSTGQDTLTGGGGGDVFVMIDDMGSADLFSDFKANEDFIQLGGSLLFADLRIEQGNGFNINDTVISNKTSGQLIAVLLGVPAETITEETFNVPTDLPGDGGGGGGGGGGGDTGLTANPKLQGAELLVANQAGVVGTVAASDATNYTITTVENDAGTAVADGVTVDAEGQLTLTEAGATAINADGVDFLDVTIQTEDGDEGTIRIFGQIDSAVADEAIGNDTDTSVGEAPDTILVAAGTYDEDLNITKSVKLLGANTGVAGNAETREDEANLTGDVILVSSDITLDGFQLTGSQVNATGTGDRLAVSNNRFEATTGGGIDVQLTETHTNITIENNFFGAMVGTAIRAQRWGENSTISNNTIEITQAGAAIDGIFVDSLTGTTISNNTIETPAAGGSGIEIGGSQSTGGASSDVTISENTITGAAGAGTANTDGGITLRNGNFTNLDITNNTVSGYSAADTTGSLLIAAGTAIPAADAVSITDNILAAASPGFSIYVASTNVPTLNIAGNSSVEGTALIAANVDAAGTTQFVFT